MMCERWRGLKLVDRFYGMADEKSVWMDDDLRGVNGGSVTALQMGEGAVHDAPPAERSCQYPLHVQVMTVR